VKDTGNQSWCLECDLNPVIGCGDLFVQLGQLLVEALEQLPACTGQLVLTAPSMSAIRRRAPFSRAAGNASFQRETEFAQDVPVLGNHDGLRSR
jgi:hypothetical protein